MRCIGTIGHRILHNNTAKTTSVGIKAAIAPVHFSNGQPRAYSSFSPWKESWKVAIVGSGPSGCYTAKYLESGIRSKLSSTCTIDVLERLPTPYGLVRNGVAPDHPEVKNVQNDFDALFAQDNLRFFGNVLVGGEESDVSLTELQRIYDIVVLAYGCESDRELKLPILAKDGADISSRGSPPKGVLSARQFVNWYNGHPDFEWVTERVQRALSNSKEQNIVVVGHGNVALDCARILAKSRSSLDPTDLTTRAMNVLRPEGAEDFKRTISLVGRRGHVQGAFTIKEIRELTKLSDTDKAVLVVREDELDLGMTETSQAELTRPKTRIHKLLEDHASKPLSEEADTRVHLRFLTNPVRYEASSDDLQLLSVVCERTQLEGDHPGSQRAVGTGSYETLDADLCLVSIGYKGLPIDETTQAAFDLQAGILRNDHGRVLEEQNESSSMAPLYVSGWLKRGPNGIIGTNIGDAKDTVLSILKDLKNGSVVRQPSETKLSLESLLDQKRIQYVDWDGYQRIQQYEASPEHKRNPDQPREKIVDKGKLLEVSSRR